jgi:histone-lysine N-methyltransferase SETMAR
MCQKIVTEDLQMRCMAVKFVPRLLTVEQKDDHVSICTGLQDQAQNDSTFTSSVITGDECWVYGYDLETKLVSSQWNTASSQPKKARQVKSNVKTMLIAFFDTDRLVHHDYVSTGQMVNNKFYKTVLQCLHDTVHRHCPEKWCSGSWILHHDNAPAHRAVTSNEFLVKHNIPLLQDPPYSPDLAPCNFFFQQLKK